jgi:rhomboid family GlyGly-CTERM serine protease
MSAEPDTPPDSPPAAAQRFPATADLVPITLAVLAIAAQVGGVDAFLWLRYDRAAVLGGQVWRLLTGHLVHLGWIHLAMNLAGLVLIWLLFGRTYNVGQWTVTVVACAVGISLGFVMVHPELMWYVGLSGVLHGMFVAGAVGGLFAGNRAEWLLLGLLVLKLFWEQHQGPMVGTEHMIGGLVVVDSHLYGALLGLGAALGFRLAAKI